MKVLDLFAGRGGFTIGLEKAGMETVAFCENDPKCQEKLKKHWPEIPIFGDIRKINCATETEENSYTFETLGMIDLICGGYPCAGHSVAGKKDGLKNEESKLWREYLRLAGEIKPKYCIIENSANLGNTGLVELANAFIEIGYNIEWETISGYSIGAPNQRYRLYIVLWRKELPYCDPFRLFRADLKKEKAQSFWWAKRRFKRSPLFKQAAAFEPKVLQFNNGLSEELLKVEDEIEMIGNSLFPQIPELIGRAIMESENENKIG